MHTAMITLLVSMYSCKTKKLSSKPVQQPVAAAPASETKAETAPAEEVKKEENSSETIISNLNFSNIQFEFNSIVLKTSSYPVLDQIASAMKSNSGTKFVINGHSSAEGSDAHNMSLSVDRANAVKTYLVNAGVDVSILKTAGFGESRPVTTNNTEAGRALNRRVELKKAE